MNKKASCHTYPNDKLLQLKERRVENKDQSCHTYPNDKLLQHQDGNIKVNFGCCHTYPNDKLLQQKTALKSVRCIKLSYLSKR